jgi:hypothetical protein
MAGGHCRPLHRAPSPLLLLPPCYTELTSPPFSLTRAPSKVAGRRPRFPSSQFSSPSALCATASQLPTEPVRAVPQSPHRLPTRSPSHRRHRFFVSSVSQSSVRRGFQLVCASPSPFSSGTAGPHHRHHPSPEHHRHHWTSSRHLRSAPARRAAARVSHCHRHLVRRVVAASTVLAPPFSGHLVYRST